MLNPKWLEKEGDKPALRWVENLDLIYGSKNKNKVCQVPFPSKNLDPIIATAFFFLRKIINDQNLLVAHVQFIVREGSRDCGKRRCLDGGHLYFGEKHTYNRQRVSVFVSTNFPAPNKKDRITDKCNKLLKHIFKKNCPELEFFSGENLTTCSNNGHTEDWLLQCLKQKPEVLSHNLFSAFGMPHSNSESTEKPKLYGTILNLWSIWDVCGEYKDISCRKMLFDALRTKDFIKNLSSNCHSFFQLPKLHSIRLAIRVQSDKNYFRKNTLLSEIKGRNFDVKDISTHKLILASRKKKPKNYEKRLTGYLGRKILLNLTKTNNPDNRKLLETYFFEKKDCFIGVKLFNMYLDEKKNPPLRESILETTIEKISKNQAASDEALKELRNVYSKNSVARKTIEKISKNLKINLKSLGIAKNSRTAASSSTKN
ncbi:hypothetical protein [Candidatus Neptunochlamydia vexilliferae]|uniref:hypothetical protein n=1 Tax=Candidatus Neptunichlamydia vexilliferae TaxID=1651774 RepID=UPI001891D43E|nr:hypothetical protein [Candidatus Neptunochlamydia vexilliferae]